MSNMKQRSIFVYLVVLLAVSTKSSAWRPKLPLVTSKSPFAFVSQSRIRKSWVDARQSHLRSKRGVEEVEDSSTDQPQKRLIEVHSELKLPFSAEVAFDAYSNLPRQSSWSSWLHSVEYVGEGTENSKWTMKFMGVRYSWTAIALQNDRPHTIRWKSTSGLQNFGTVRFFNEEANESTLMTMKMSFIAPRAVASLFRRSKRLANFVQEKMIMDSMVQFRDTVVENDLKD